MRGGLVLGAARSRECRDLSDLRVTARWRLGGVPAAFAIVPAISAVEAGVLSEKAPPEERSAQLGLLCACGRRPVELKGRRCCRLCYSRRYHSLRWFGGLRESILRRDRFRCRACEAERRLLVHHRDGRNAKPLLIALCICLQRFNSEPSDALKLSHPPVG